MSVKKYTVYKFIGEEKYKYREDRIILHTNIYNVYSAGHLHLLTTLYPSVSHIGHRNGVLFSSSWIENSSRRLVKALGNHQSVLLPDDRAIRFVSLVLMKWNSGE